ncbi:MAG: AraC family transcriptional regulator [Coprobacter sp.]|nr:AraC family transcriptional regulator [Coprobacter sp.]
MNKTDRPDIVIGNSMTCIGQGELKDYVTHAYCRSGSCSFSFNDQRYTFSAGDCLIMRHSRLITDVVEGAGFETDIIFVTPEFIEISTPQSNYGMRGSVSLFHNPILRLSPEQQEVCRLDFDYIKRRLALPHHHFHRDAMINAVECLIIDLFDFHAELYGKAEISISYAQLMERFMGMLERGDFRRNREIGYYASALCITPKYLSEVSKKISGFPASYWINRYTTLDISRRLKEKNRCIKELADFYHFSSASYFSRYVQKYLRMQPSDFLD